MKWILFISLALLWGHRAEARLQLVEPDGTFKTLVYKPGGDSAVVLILIKMESLEFQSTMALGSIKYDPNRGYYIVVPPKMKQKLTVLNPMDPTDYVDISIPPLEPRQVIEFKISNSKESALLRGKGLLHINTVPQDAQIEFEGFGRISQSPFADTMNALEYRLFITKDRYKPTDVIVSVEKNKTTSKTISLQPAWADIFFTSDRNDGILQLNGTSYKFSKDSVAFVGEKYGLIEGRYEYVFQAPGSKSQTGFLMVDAGISRTIPLNSPLEYAEFHLNTKPQNIHVELDGIYQGKTPFTLKKIPSGKHRIKMYSAYTDTISEIISLDQYQNTLHRELEIIASDLQIDCPDGGKIVVGKWKGDCPWEKRIPLGDYKVRFSHPDYNKWKDQIHVTSIKELVQIPAQPLAIQIPYICNIKGAELFINKESQGFLQEEGIIQIDGSLLGESISLEVVSRGYDSFEHQLIANQRTLEAIDITLSKAQLSRDEIIQLIGEKKNEFLTYSDIDTLLANGLELGSGRRYWATAGFLYSNDVEDSIFSASFGFGYLFPNIPLNMNLGIRNISITRMDSYEEYTKEGSSYLELELRSGAYWYYLLDSHDEIKAYRFGFPELGSIRPTISSKHKVTSIANCHWSKFKGVTDDERRKENPNSRAD